MASGRRVLWAVSLGHMSLDMFNGMIAVLLVFISGHLFALTNTQIGLAISIYQLSGALAQPVFGLLGDRTGGRWLGAGGVAWTVALLALALLTAQLTGSYVLLLVMLVPAAFGSAAFHPVGAMHAAEASRERAASNTAIFFLSGQLGLAIGPALAGFLLDQYATHNNLAFTEALGPVYAGRLLETGTVVPVVLLAIIALPAVLFMSITLPPRHLHTAQREAAAAADPSSAAGPLSLPVKAVALLVTVVALRSLLSPGLVAFIPGLFQLKGWDPTEYGIITGVYWVGGGFAGVIIGYLADRWDGRYLIALTLLLAAPAVLALAAFNGVIAFVLALATGALSGGSHSLLVLQAQRLLPGRRGLASGAILGFMFATGALGSLIIGSMADAFGLINAFYVVGGVAVVTAVLSLGLQPDERYQPRRLSETEAEASDPSPVRTGAD